MYTRPFTEECRWLLLPDKGIVTGRLKGVGTGKGVSLVPPGWRRLTLPGFGYTMELRIGWQGNSPYAGSEQER